MSVHRQWATFVYLGALALGLIVGVCASPWFGVRTVVIKGGDADLRAEVQRQVSVPAQASMLFYPLHRITRQAREVYRVGEVKVRRASPHVLEVTVSARPPLLALDDGTGFTLASGDGTLLYRTSQAPPGMPQVVGLGPARAPLGSQVDQERWRWARDVVEGATKAKLREGLQVDMTNLHQIRVRTPDGVAGLLGNVNHLSRKAAVMGRVIEQLRAEGKTVVSVDVSVPEMPMWKVK